MIRKTMVFIDGENLTMRYQAMLAEGRKPRESLVYEPDVFVWSPEIIKDEYADIRRVTYYTSVVGDDARLEEIRNRLRKCEYTFRGETLSARGRLVPRVFKKPKKSYKSRAVDINIAVDILTHTYNNSADAIYLISGDGDFLPVVEEIMRRGKEFKIGALSSGLNSSLRHAGDDFSSLDLKFFELRAEDLNISHLFGQQAQSSQKIDK